MKIVHVGFSHRPDDIRIFQKECSSLAKFGYDVTYITSDRNADKPEGLHNNIRVMVLRLKKMKRIQRFFKYCRDLKRTLVELDADIYHFHEVVLLPVLAYMFRRGKIVIYDLHEDSPRDLQPYLCRKYGPFFGKAITEIIDRYENYWIKKVRFVIAATPHIEERCRKYSSNVSLVANYPLLNYESLEESVFVERGSEIQLKGVTLCYCGAMSKDRNISMYVKMMECIDGKLLLAGSLSDSFRKQLETYQSWDKVEYLGYLNQEAVAGLYQKSNIGLCVLQNTPNTFHSLPIKLFEYMRTGLPVICSDFPQWKEIVEGNNCGICIPCNDMNKAVEAVQYFAMYPQIAKEKGKNGMEAVKKKYNWNSEEEKLILLYKNIIKASK